LERKIDPSVIEDLKLGYVESPLNEEHEKYSGYIAIPYLTRAGPVGLRFKRTTTYGAKALAFEGTQALPYNVAALSKSGPLFVVEGEPDTWAALSAGLNAVGIPGVESWKPLWRRLFRNHPDVRILQQGDTKIPAGKTHTAAVGLTRAIKSSGVFASTIAFPDNEDVNSMLIDKGQDALRAYCGLDEFE
jgi:hypothetical protein